MRVLLDTNILIFIAREPERLSRQAKLILENPASQRFYSPVSFWEMAIQSGRGRFEIDVPFPEYERLLIAQAAYEGLALISSDSIFDKYKEIERIW